MEADHLIGNLVCLLFIILKANFVQNLNIAVGTIAKVAAKDRSTHFPQPLLSIQSQSNNALLACLLKDHEFLLKLRPNVQFRLFTHWRSFGLKSPGFSIHELRKAFAIHRNIFPQWTEENDWGSFLWLIRFNTARSFATLACLPHWHFTNMRI